MNLQKRIEKLQAALEVRRARACICSEDARYHNTKESAAARQIACPVHGKRHLRCFIDLPITMALDPSDRHLCHCPPMPQRQAEEEGRELTREEMIVAKAQYEDWFEKEVERLYPDLGRRTW